MSITIARIEFDHVRYDSAADVLYLHVGEPSSAVAFDESPDGHALRYDGDGNLVGITVVGARRLVEQRRDVHVNAPVTLHADELAAALG